jgi:hypothetical protein
VPFTVMKAMGMSDTSFGQQSLRADQPLAELLA